MERRDFVAAGVAAGAAALTTGRPLHDYVMASANQEHGIVEHRRGAAAAGDVEARFPIGTRLRILPNHACATAAQHAGYAVIEGGRVQARWPRFNGW